MSHPSGVRDEKLERILKNPPKVTDGEVIVHKTKEPFGHSRSSSWEESRKPSRRPWPTSAPATSSR